MFNKFNMSYLDDIKTKYDIKDYKESPVNVPNLPTEGIVLIVGTSGSGKTTILKTVDDPKPLVIDYTKNVIDIAKSLKIVLGTS